MDRFDILPLLVATDGAIAALGVDHRRLRPNIVVQNVEGLVERAWPGRRLRVGDAVLAVSALCSRCAVTTIAPDTQMLDPTVLERIASQFGGRVALDCAVGDPVELR